MGLPETEETTLNSLLAMIFMYQIKEVVTYYFFSFERLINTYQLNTSGQGTIISFDAV